MAGALALAIGMSGCGGVGPSEIARLARSDPVVAQVYRSHKDRPLWLRGDRLNDRGRLVVEVLSRAGDDGLDPRRYLPKGLRDGAVVGDPAVFDVELSRALIAYAADLRRPTAKPSFTFTDPALTPVAPRAPVLLERVAFGPKPRETLAVIRRINPLYDGLRTALVKQRQVASATPEARRTERLILINMDRARVLPPDFGRRYVWVDIPAARLTAFEGGAPRLSMAVVVGKPEMQTPMMVGLLRYAVVNPYWNIPEDLVRDSIAPKVMRQGERYLRAENIELLSDWSEHAAPIAPTQVAWSQVASGATSLRARQRPGPSNMMGSMKIMSPNAMGIYLHDTPHRDLFAASARTFSSGCVRLEDAPALGRWLFGRDVRSSTAPPETRVDLPSATPLYLTYFTAVPTPDGGIEERPDIYGLDKAQGRRIATGDISGAS